MLLLVACSVQPVLLYTACHGGLQCVWPYTVFRYERRELQSADGRPKRVLPDRSKGKRYKGKIYYRRRKRIQRCVFPSAPCLSYCVYDGVLYCVSRESVNASLSQLFVTTYRFYDGNMGINAINGVSVQNREDFATDGQRLYFVNAAQKREVCVYSLQGKRLYTLSCDFPVCSFLLTKTGFWRLPPAGCFLPTQARKPFLIAAARCLADVFCRFHMVI